MKINWHEYLMADHEAGTLTWRSRPREHFPSDWSWKVWNKRYAQKVAGGTDASGYFMVKLLGKKRLAHRILFEMANGPIPEGLEIDHVDRNKDNNSRINLRLATRSENNRNCGMRSNNTSCSKGVYWHKATGKWMAYINHNGRRIHLGLFRVFEEAVAARRDAELKYFGEFAQAAS